MTALGDFIGSTPPILLRPDRLIAVSWVAKNGRWHLIDGMQTPPRFIDQVMHGTMTVCGRPVRRDANMTIIDRADIGGHEVCALCRERV